MTGLSAAQLGQRADARQQAVIFRKRRMVRRLYEELRRVQKMLSDMGVEVDLEGNVMPDGSTMPANGPGGDRVAAAIDGVEGSTLAACSEAGAALRRCAEAKRTAAIASRRAGSS